MDILINVIEIKLNNLYLPLSWYVIDVNADINNYY